MGTNMTPPDSSRAFEAFLREQGGFSRSRAKALTAKGWDHDQGEEKMNDLQKITLSLKAGEQRLLELKARERYVRKITANSSKTFDFNEARHGETYNINVYDDILGRSRVADKVTLDISYYQPNGRRSFSTLTSQSNPKRIHIARLRGGASNHGSILLFVTVRNHGPAREFTVELN